VRLLEDNHRPEIPLQEFLALVNEGTGNTGWANKGNSNEGDCNKGDCNEGDSNEGDCNKGDWKRTRATRTRATATRATATRANWNKGDCNKGSNEGDRQRGRLQQGQLEQGRPQRGRLRNIGSYNRADGACGIFNTDGGCVIFNRYTPMKHIEIEKTDGYRYLALCVAMRREPTEEELAEIRKLPNFDKKVMNELIFGKGDKK
jgi:hypothetical protein